MLSLNPMTTEQEDRFSHLVALIVWVTIRHVQEVWAGIAYDEGFERYRAEKFLTGKVVKVVSTKRLYGNYANK